MNRVLVVFCLIVVFYIKLPGQQLGFSLAENVKRVQIPIEIHNNLIVLPVVINNQLPLKFILDTGVRTTILTEKSFSDILDLPYSRQYSISGPGGEKLIEAFVTNNVSIDLPGIRGKGHAMLVLEQDYLELRNYLGTDVHGVLGYELFSRFVIQIDYKNNRIVLTQPDKFKPGRRYQVFPLTVEDTKPYMMATIVMNDSTQVDAKLLVDSGASHGIMIDPESNLNLAAPERHIESIIGRGLGGVITGKIGRIDALELGKYTLKNVIANFPDPNSYNDTLKLDRDVFRNGSIGGEVLTRFNVAINLPGEKLYLKKNSSYKKKFYYNLSGITIKAKGARLRRYEITDVRANSSGERGGLQNGDIILSVNGIAAESLSLTILNGFFNSKPQRKVTLEIERAGVKMKKVMRLEDQI
ncbi:MAG: PDZ domain-containing protein [Flammeovirgaceae bacterium]|nr:PDZ domain-containing protein [Flammeovirgaceae bacterium]